MTYIVLILENFFCTKLANAGITKFFDVWFFLLFCIQWPTYFMRCYSPRSVWLMFQILYVDIAEHTFSYKTLLRLQKKPQKSLTTNTNFNTKKIPYIAEDPSKDLTKRNFSFKFDPVKESKGIFKKKNHISCLLQKGVAKRISSECGREKVFFL